MTTQQAVAARVQAVWPTSSTVSDAIVAKRDQDAARPLGLAAAVTIRERT